MTDDELFDRYRQSHEPALLDELVRRNFDRIYRFVATMLGKPDAVDDLVQDILLNVVRSIDKFRGESALSTWIYRIAANRVHRFLEETQRAVPTIETEQLEAVTDRHRESPETNELKHLIDTAISELSPALRAAMLLTTVEGLTPDEAAAIENCSAENIHWRVHKARKILKERLQKYIE
jgi:RNA polymerase sigma-70 factor (ECF subfamily)